MLPANIEIEPMDLSLRDEVIAFLVQCLEEDSAILVETLLKMDLP